jgi:hypothetical protein
MIEEFTIGLGPEDILQKDGVARINLGSEKPKGSDRIERNSIPHGDKARTADSIN